MGRTTGTDSACFEIQIVSQEQLREVIRRYAPRGLFLTKEGRRWTAVDNTTGNAWTEEFRWKRQAVRWLRGEFEVDGRPDWPAPKGSFMGQRRRPW